MKQSLRAFNFFALSLFFLLCFEGKSQTIFVNQSSVLHKLDLSSCTSVSIATLMYTNGGGSTSSVSAADIAFHPSGDLYAIDGNRLYIVDTITAVASLVVTHGISGPKTLVVDAAGNMYTSDANDLFQIDLTGPTVTNLGTLPCASAGDMFFNQNQLYLTCANNDLLQVNIANPAASTVQGSLGFTSYASFTVLEACSPPKSYVWNSWPNQDILLVDPANGSTTLHCATSIYGDGATSMHEFILPAGSVNAGPDTSWNICTTTNFDLDTMITANADAGGVWVDNGNFILAMPVSVSATESFKYIVGSAGCLDTAIYTIQFSAGSNAGIDTTWSICGATNYDLDTMLTGSANTGGTWYDNGYTLAVMPVSVTAVEIYHYITGSGGCLDTADYNIQFSAGGNAGVDTTWSICGTQNYDLNNFLTATADAGGVWYDNAFSGVGMPVSISATSTYNYIVGGVGCEDTAIYTIQFNALSSAGADTSWNICGATNYDLDTLITTGATAGGSWYDNTFTPVGMPIAVTATGSYHYIVGSGACFDTATYLIQIAIAGSAGADTTWTTCNSGNYDLNNYLTGTANTGGTWYDNTFAIATMPVSLSANAIFNYVIGAVGCEDTAVYNIQFIAGGNAGIDTTWNICTSSNYDLDTLLTATANAGGSWFDNAFTLAAMPVTIAATSTYYYIDGTPGCEDTATFDVQFVSAGNAGADTTWNICITTSYDLNNHLTAGADAGGTWYDNTFVVATMPVAVSSSQQYHYIIGTPGCMDTASFDIQLVPMSEYAGNDTTIVICNTNTIDLFPFLNGNPTAGGTWYLTNGTPQAMPVDPLASSYLYVVGSGQCFDTAIVQVQNQQIQGDFNATPSLIYTAETVVDFTGLTINASTYQWEIDGVVASIFPNYSQTFNTPGTHIICLISSNLQCADTVCKTVEVFDRTYIYVPNAFSPNGDGFNELFGPSISTNLGHYEFYVFDRWGEKLFETNEQAKFWDGTFKNEKVEGGSYTWRMKYKTSDGIEFKALHGHVLLLK